MNTITFITGNKNKLKEVQAILKDFEVVNLKLDLPEIQEVDAKAVIEAKLDEAHSLHQGTYIVEDTSLYLNSLNNLPGPLIKWFLQELGAKGIAELAQKFPDQSATASCLIGFINEEGKKYFFEGRVEGEIVPPQGETQFGWDPIFKPKGYELTFAQMTPEEKNKISHRKLALERLAKFLRDK